MIKCACAHVSELRRGRADGLRDFKAFVRAHPIPKAARRSIEAAGASQRVLEVTAAGPENEATSATKRATKRKRNIVTKRPTTRYLGSIEIRHSSTARAFHKIACSPNAEKEKKPRWLAQGCERESARPKLLPNIVPIKDPTRKCSVRYRFYCTPLQLATGGRFARPCRSE